MRFVVWLFLHWLVIQIGWPLFFFLSESDYFHYEDKYMPIRPSDVFVYMALCGWATILNIVVTITVWILANVWLALLGSLVTSLVVFFLMRSIATVILDYTLKRELEAMG